MDSESEAMYYCEIQWIKGKKYDFFFPDFTTEVEPSGTQILDMENFFCIEIFWLVNVDEMKGTD